MLGEGRIRDPMQMNVDVEAWLSAKLENPWSSERLASTLSVPTLQQIKSRFALLDTPIKLRLLFSFASLRKKLKDELESEVQDLLVLGSEDDDEWVRVISKMLEVLLKEGPPEGEGSSGGGRGGDISKNGPSSNGTTTLHSHLEALALALNNEHFTDVIEQVRQRLEERTEPLRFHPLEFPFLNKELVPELPTTTEPHFKLKKPLEEPAPPPSILKRSTSKTVPFKSSTPDVGAEKGGLSKSGSHMARSVSLGGSSPGLRNSSGGGERGIKRSLNASRGSLGGLSSSHKKLRVLDLDEVLGMEQNQEVEKMKKKHAEEEQEKERRRKEKHDIAEAKRQEREEKKKKRNEELEKRKAKKEEEKAEKEAKRKERIAALAQAKAQRKAAAAAAAASKKSATSPELSPELSPTMDSPVTTPSHTPTFSPLASPFVASPSPAMQQRTPQQPGGASSAPSGLSSLTSPGGIGVTVGGGMGALGSGGISTAPSGPYGSASLSSALHSGASAASQQPGMKPYSFGGGLSPLGGGPGSSSLGSAPSFLQGTSRPGGQASSLLSQALHPSQAPSQPYNPGQPVSQSSLLSAFSASRQHPMAHHQQQQQQPPSSLLSAYMNQQQPQHTGYGSVGGNSLGLGGQPSMLSSYGVPQPHIPPQPVGVPGNLLEQANRLSDRDRQLLVAFLKGESPGQLPTHGVRQILLNEEEKLGEGGARYLEQIIFEINYQSGSWRKLRRKKVLSTPAPPPPPGPDPTKPAA